MMRILLVGFVLGAFLAYSYDWLRIFRRLKRHNHFAVFVEDLFYWFQTGILIFGILQLECHGILRYYMVLMSILGILVYYKLIGNFAVPSVVYIIRKSLGLICVWKRWLTRQMLRSKMILCKLFRRNHINDDKKVHLREK